MNQVKYAYIVKTASYDSKNHKAVFETDSFKTNIVGVSSVEEACKIAVELTKTGTSMIDLCSGFKEEDAKKVYNAVKSVGPVRVGFIGKFFVEA